MNTTRCTYIIYTVYLLKVLGATITLSMAMMFSLHMRTVRVTFPQEGDLDLVPIIEQLLLMDTVGCVDVKCLLPVEPPDQ